jgi:Domain of unknown function (DUF397)
MSERRDALAQAQWRKSSFSGGSNGGGGDCVEVAALADGRIAIRDSKCSEAGTVYFTHAEIGAWLKALKAGEFDGLG